MSQTDKKVKAKEKKEPVKKAAKTVPEKKTAPKKATAQAAEKKPFKTF